MPYSAGGRGECDNKIQKVIFASKMRAFVRSGHTNDKLNSHDLYCHVDGSIADE